MTAIILYAALLLLAASVLVNRMGERRVRATREALATADKDIRTMEQRVQESRKTLEAARGKLGGLEEALVEAKRQTEVLEGQLDALQQTPVELYHVFDRLEARPGTIWEVTVRRAPDALYTSAAMAASWRDGRTYLIVASNQKEALDRAAQRFPRVNGYEVGPVLTCRLFLAKDAERKRA
ncbi:hypothetical protein [Azospirillum isscasi]|uniref:Uncharacterized protein n=1 Tax=Azospirillum isscasi TaxID=3053926 RepID=A0ABU0WMW1_9PROT|nr:hypothetical protein [Azospirillum isscasi]MDQ2105569.1 hypothetical protein [Azospirillum isscasi]